MRKDKIGSSTTLREEMRARWRGEIATIVQAAGGIIIPTIAISTIRAMAPEADQLQNALVAEGYSARAIDNEVIEIDIQGSKRGGSEAQAACLSAWKLKPSPNDLEGSAC